MSTKQAEPECKSVVEGDAVFVMFDRPWGRWNQTEEAWYEAQVCIANSCRCNNLARSYQ